jgi:gamma-glutamylcyclotransferase (GGCT)/AIG2-like uncharacterized protein YtfP
MERVFAYGTLLLERVQLQVIGRVVDVCPDVLAGYRTEHVTFGGGVFSYQRVRPATGSRVTGGVLEVTQEELAHIDAYEGSDFERVRTALEDGTDVWVYARPRQQG